jgi:putative transferase (TIGR04331 family)
MSKRKNHEEHYLSSVSPVRLELSKTIAKELAVVLNKIHGIKLSERFWTIILGSYINSAITCRQLFESKEIFSSANLLAINSDKPVSFQTKVKNNTIRFLKFIVSAKNFGKIKNILEHNDNLALTFPDIDIIQKEIGVNFPIYTPFFWGKGDSQKRQRACEIADEYKDLFMKNIIKQLPKAYIEYFKIIFDSVPLFNPQKKTFHVHMMQSVHSEILVAKYVDNGAKLFWYQHGGCYGELENHNGHLIESSLADEFRTWGWKINPNDVPWKAYRVEKFKVQYNKINPVKSFDCLLCYGDIHEGNIKDTKEMTDFFLCNIDPSKYNKFLARPRPFNKIFSRKSNISFITDNRITKDAGLSDMIKLVKQSKLVIQFEIPCTNFLECLYVNHPTIGLLFGEEPSEIIKPYFEFFMSNGVYHETMESLVRHLNNINIDEWWQELIKHPLYKSFKYEFLREVKTEIK